MPNGPPASVRNLASAVRTLSRSRPMLLTMSAKIVSSSAPGTSYFALAGTIMPATQRRSAISVSVRIWSLMSASIEQCCQALFHAVSDVQRQRLYRRRRIHAARSDEDAAVHDEQI